MKQKEELEKKEEKLKTIISQISEIKAILSKEKRNHSPKVVKPSYNAVDLKIYEQKLKFISSPINQKKLHAKTRPSQKKTGEKRSKSRLNMSNNIKL